MPLNRLIQAKRKRKPRSNKHEFNQHQHGKTTPSSSDYGGTDGTFFLKSSLYAPRLPTAPVDARRGDIYITYKDFTRPHVPPWRMTEFNIGYKTSFTLLIGPKDSSIQSINKVKTFLAISKRLPVLNAHESLYLSSYVEFLRTSQSASGQIHRSGTSELPRAAPLLFAPEILAEDASDPWLDTEGRSGSLADAESLHFVKFGRESLSGDDIILAQPLDPEKSEWPVSSQVFKDAVWRLVQVKLTKSQLRVIRLMSATEFWDGEYGSAPFFMDNFDILDEDMYFNQNLFNKFIMFGKLDEAFCVAMKTIAGVDYTLRYQALHRYGNNAYSDNPHGKEFTMTPLESYALTTAETCFPMNDEYYILKHPSHLYKTRDKLPSPTEVANHGKPFLDPQSDSAFRSGTRLVASTNIVSSKLENIDSPRFGTGIEHEQEPRSKKFTVNRSHVLKALENLRIRHTGLTEESKQHFQTNRDESAWSSVPLSNNTTSGSSPSSEAQRLTKALEKATLSESGNLYVITLTVPAQAALMLELCTAPRRMNVVDGFGKAVRNIGMQNLNTLWKHVTLSLHDLSAVEIMLKELCATIQHKWGQGAMDRAMAGMHIWVVDDEKLG